MKCGMIEELNACLDGEKERKNVRIWAYTGVDERTTMNPRVKGLSA